MKKFIKKYFKWLIFILCILLFLLIIEDVFDKEIVNFDNAIYNIIYRYGNYDLLNFITYFGSALILIPLTIILFIIIKNKKIGLSVIINLCIISLLNFILKIIFQRPRPEFRLINVSGYSFPSGHSMISLAFYGYLIYLIYNSKFNKVLKIILIVSLSLLIVTIGISRIYLGVHYASDVIGGFSLSLAYLILYIMLVKKVGVNDETSS